MLFPSAQRPRTGFPGSFLWSRLRVLSAAPAFFLLLALVVAAPLWAQPDTLPTVDYLEPQEFEIGGVTVTGNRFTDANTLVGISGLTVGKKIRLPGDETRDAVKKLMKLRLFTNVEINDVKHIGDVVFLDIVVTEKPRLSRYYYTGVPKAQHDDLNKAVERILVKGSIVTENVKSMAVNALLAYYRDKGFTAATVKVMEEPDDILVNSTKLGFQIDKGRRVPIGEVVFTGNQVVKTGKLRRLLKKTKQKRWYAFFLSAKFIQEEYEKDKEKLMAHYSKIGHRDARILRDSVYVIKKGGREHLRVEIDLQEGHTYYFGNIAIKGNSVYTDKKLRDVLGIRKGDVYNEDLLQSRINFDQSGRDISSLYLDFGYLFFRANPVETGIRGDSIDIEIRLSEGPQATIDKIIIKGNDRTHEHVIRREIRTRPGQKFSRADIIRSQREIVALNYFNPEKLQINPKVNPERGTVDIEYTVEERPADQLELSAGWGGVGRGVIGTLGVTFNNFSLRNIFKPEAWNPLPQGDGQRLSLRVQTTGKFFQLYNFSFTEPWLGGKRPNAFSVAVSYSRQTNGRPPQSSSYAGLGILSTQVSLGTRLRWPDDNFVSQTSLGYQNYSIKGGSFGFVYSDEAGNTYSMPQGTYHGVTLNQTISRNTIYDPIFPRQGSLISLSMSFTPPYSLFNDRDYSVLPANERYKFLEYYKFNVRAEWYHRIVGNLVLKSAAKLGYLGSYNSGIGPPPFERFQVGGDGINIGNFQQGYEIISARGYDVPDITPGGRQSGAAIFNKFILELRYPISLNPSSTIYVLGFFEGTNAWNRFRDYDPFDLKRSAGLGLRVFLPMFGTLGFDYGIGFDKTRGPNDSWLSLGRFNIVLGFEPQ